jgi:hypothetical protein
VSYCLVIYVLLYFSPVMSRFAASAYDVPVLEEWRFLIASESNTLFSTFMELAAL